MQRRKRFIFDTYRSPLERSLGILSTISAYRDVVHKFAMRQIAVPAGTVPTKRHSIRKYAPSFVRGTIGDGPVYTNMSVATVLDCFMDKAKKQPHRYLRLAGDLLECLELGLIDEAWMSQLNHVSPSALGYRGLSKQVKQIRSAYKNAEVINLLSSAKQATGFGRAAL